MDRRAFTSANVVGALPWAIGLPVLGAMLLPWGGLLWIRVWAFPLMLVSVAISHVYVWLRYF